MTIDAAAALLDPGAFADDETICYCESCSRMQAGKRQLARELVHQVLAVVNLPPPPPPADIIDRLDEAHKRIATMCSEGRPPRMTIPVRPDDDDRFICQAIRDAQELIQFLRTQV